MIGGSASPSQSENGLPSRCPLRRWHPRWPPMLTDDGRAPPAGSVAMALERADSHSLFVQLVADALRHVLQRANAARHQPQLIVLLLHNQLPERGRGTLGSVVLIRQSGKLRPRPLPSLAPPSLPLAPPTCCCSCCSWMYRELADTRWGSSPVAARAAPEAASRA